MLDYLRGSEYLNVFFRCLGATIGRDVCLYPTGASPMMTEPDLVSFGDGACVNGGGLIASLTRAFRCHSLVFILLRGGRRSSDRNLLNALTYNICHLASNIFHSAQRLGLQYLSLGVEYVSLC